VRPAIAAGELPASRLENYRKLKGEQAAKAPTLRKPGAVASKPSWKKKAEEHAAQPFRHRHHRED
jgi:ribosome biogenesis GTPase